MKEKEEREGKKEERKERRIQIMKVISYTVALSLPGGGIKNKPSQGSERLLP